MYSTLCTGTSFLLYRTADLPKENTVMLGDAVPLCIYQQGVDYLPSGVSVAMYIIHKMLFQSNQPKVSQIISLS